ncbi:hypothetical protein B0J12DRAFT_205349 [Macrophomina phaseolina]|uniref:Uncharacterized protein n=1 Tax=Macrophomina phaseolina TaxID=35725 RepID=A0ABQ8G268_9PEZI|nr:hypothetical protein B0J12DRAFT_205349 [Macrophomina phaseolina]
MPKKRITKESNRQGIALRARKATGRTPHLLGGDIQADLLSALQSFTPVKAALTTPPPSSNQSYRIWRGQSPSPAHVRPRSPSTSSSGRDLFIGHRGAYSYPVTPEPVRGPTAYRGKQPVENPDDGHRSVRSVAAVPLGLSGGKRLSGSRRRRSSEGDRGHRRLECRTEHRRGKPCGQPPRRRWRKGRIITRHLQPRVRRQD